MEPDPKDRQRERYRRMMAKHALRQDNEREHAAERKARKLLKKRSKQKPREKLPEVEPLDLVATPDQAAAAPQRDASARLREATVLAVDRTRVEIWLDGEHTSARRHPRLVSIVAGDVVEISTATDGIHRAERLTTRRTLLCREDPGRPGRPKPIAANLDVGLITIPGDRPRWGLVHRIVRALTNGGIDAVVVATKLDLAVEAEIEERLAAFRADGVEGFAVSVVDGRGLDPIRAVIAGRTCALLGHSGAGKSSLANALDPGHERRTGAVRAGDHRGRHTTSRSFLSVLGDGTRILDTPGIRAFGVVD